MFTKQTPASEPNISKEGKDICKVVECCILHYCIKSSALTGEKPCIDKAIHALLMHGYATFNMIVSGPQIYCRYEMCTARPWNEHSPWKLRSQDIGEKAKQKSARNNAKCNKCFQFNAIIAIKHGFSMHFRQVPREVLKTAASGLGFQHLPRDLANVNA